MSRKENNRLSIRKRFTAPAALFLGLLLIMTSSSAFAGQKLLVNSSSVNGNCFSIDARLVGFTSAEYGDLQFIVFLVDPTTGQTAQTAVPAMTELKQKNLKAFPAVNRKSHQMSITGCASDLNPSDDLQKQ